LAPRRRLGRRTSFANWRKPLNEQLFVEVSVRFNQMGRSDEGAELNGRLVGMNRKTGGGGGKWCAWHVSGQWTKFYA